MTKNHDGYRFDLRALLVAVSAIAIVCGITRLLINEGHFSYGINLLGTTYYGGELAVLAFAVLNLGTISRDARACDNYRLRTAAIVVAHGVFATTLTAPVFVLVPNPNATLALVGSLSFVAIGLLIATRCSRVLTAVLLVAATATLMRGSQLVLNGSRYFYEGVPVGIWAGQLAICGALLCNLYFLSAVQRSSGERV